jgi:hypothetical protein
MGRRGSGIVLEERLGRRERRVSRRDTAGGSGRGRCRGVETYSSRLFSHMNEDALLRLLIGTCGPTIGSNRPSNDIYLVQLQVLMADFLSFYVTTRKPVLSSTHRS